MAFDVICAPNWRFENVTQHAAELWLIRDGECVVRQGERCETARKGDIVWLQPHQHRLTINESSQPLSIVGFAYQATLLRTVDFSTAMEAPLVLREGVDLLKLETLLNRVVEASRERAPGQLFEASGAAQTSIFTALQPLITDDTDFARQTRGALQRTLGGDIAAAMQVVFVPAISALGLFSRHAVRAQSGRSRAATHRRSGFAASRFLLHLDQVFLKPARHGAGTNWHQDNAYFNIPDPLKGTALWTAVHDANEANGTMRVVPRSFHEKLEHARGPDSDHHIRCYPDESQVVMIEVPAGGALFFAYGTPHATGANTTDKERAGVALHFINAEVSGEARSGFDVGMRPVLTGAEASGGLNEHGVVVAGTWDAEVARALNHNVAA